MNSDQERTLFERWGWTYNHVQRRWANPDETVYITLDMVVELTEDDPVGEGLLVGLAMKYGNTTWLGGRTCR